MGAFPAQVVESRGGGGACSVSFGRVNGHRRSKNRVIIFFFFLYLSFYHFVFQFLPEVQNLISCPPPTLVLYFLPRKTPSKPSHLSLFKLLLLLLWHITSSIISFPSSPRTPPSASSVSASLSRLMSVTSLPTPGLLRLTTHPTLLIISVWKNLVGQRCFIWASWNESWVGDIRSVFTSVPLPPWSLIDFIPFDLVPESFWNGGRRRHIRAHGGDDSWSKIKLKLCRLSTWVLGSSNTMLDQLPRTLLTLTAITAYTIPYPSLYESPVSHLNSTFGWHSPYWPIWICTISVITYSLLWLWIDFEPQVVS